MNPHKGIIAPLLLIIVAVLLLGGGAYVYTRQAQVIDTANWKTYTNAESKISVQYPPTWHTEAPRDTSLVKITDVSDVDTQGSAFVITNRYIPTCSTSDWASNPNSIYSRFVCEPNAKMTILMLAKSKDAEKIDEQILSTFKFTN